MPHGEARVARRSRSVLRARFPELGFSELGFSELGFRELGCRGDVCRRAAEEV